VKAGPEFFNFYNHDLIRMAVATPAVRVADPAFNGEQTLALISRAAERKAALVLFPELGLSAYTCDDLFQQRVVLDGCLAALEKIVEATRLLPIVSVVGTPLEVGHQLFNCAVVISRGRILGVVPKTYLPNYREFYELRQFTSGLAAPQDQIDLLGLRGIPFGSAILFRCEELRDFVFHVEICEDLWVPIPPSSYAALAGATVLLNLSASNITGPPTWRGTGRDSSRRTATCLSPRDDLPMSRNSSASRSIWSGWRRSGCGKTASPRTCGSSTSASSDFARSSFPSNRSASDA
jgi:NAD+ synthase (glutamine-hydrolysing)